MLDKIHKSEESDDAFEGSYTGPLEDGEFKNAKIALDQHTQGQFLGSSHGAAQAQLATQGA